MTAGAGIAAHAGPVRFGVRGAMDSTRAADPSDDFTYDPTMIVGFDERQRAQTGELSITLDTRRRANNLIPRSAPSSGWLLRGEVAYTSGTASRTGDFELGRGTLEVRRLFDLFNGDRVLSIGARIEALTADAMEVPFERLPALGGRDRMRAFAMNELRDREATYGDIQYEWPLGPDVRSYVFVEAGETGEWHGGYGGGLRYHTSSSVAARIQIAGTESGELGMFFQLGAL